MQKNLGFKKFKVTVQKWAFFFFSRFTKIKYIPIFCVITIVNKINGL